VSRPDLRSIFFSSGLLKRSSTFLYFSAFLAALYSAPLSFLCGCVSSCSFLFLSLSRTLQSLQLPLPASLRFVYFYGLSPEVRYASLPHQCISLPISPLFDLDCLVTCFLIRKLSLSTARPSQLPFFFRTFFWFFEYLIDFLFCILFFSSLSRPSYSHSPPPLLLCPTPQCSTFLSVEVSVGSCSSCAPFAIPLFFLC